MDFKKKYRETVNPEKINWLLSLDKKELLKLIENPSITKLKKKKYLVSNDEYLTSLQDYFKFCKKNKYSYLVNYRTSLKEEVGYGRLYSDRMSFQMLAKPLRNFLAKDRYVDIDMKNAWPTILEKLFWNKRIHSPYLKKYIEDRENINKSTNLDKHLFIQKILMSDNDLTDWKDDFVNKLAYEVKINKKELYLATKDELPIFSNGNDNQKNPVSSNISKLLGREEAKIIENALKSLTSRKIIGVKDIISLCFDGFLLNKTVSVSKVLDFLNISNGKDRSDYQFIQKAWGNEIEIPCTYQPETYETLKNNFENGLVKHALILNPLCFVIYGDNREPVFRNQQEFLLQTAPFYVDGLFTFQFWINDVDRKEFDKTIFSPYVLKQDPFCKTIGKTYNVCSLAPIAAKVTDFNIGMPYESDYLEFRDKNEIFSPVSALNDFTTFIKENITGYTTVEEKKAYVWLINFIVLKIKNPNKNFEVALLFSGPMGSGKDLLIKMLSSIFGVSNDYVYNQNELGHVLGKVNTGLKNKLLVIVNELSGMDGSKYEEQFKDAITREYNLIEEKYQKPFKQKNVITICALTNREKSIRFGPENRRWILFKTKRKNVASLHPDKNLIETYWSPFYKKLESKKWINNLFTALIEYEVNPDFIPNNPCTQPRGDDYYEMVDSQIPLIYKFLYNADYSDFDGPITSNSKFYGWYYFTKTKFKQLYKKYINEDCNIKTENILDLIKNLTEVDGFAKGVRLKINDKIIKNRYLINETLIINSLREKYFKDIDRINEDRCSEIIEIENKNNNLDLNVIN